MRCAVTLRSMQFLLLAVVASTHLVSVVLVMCCPCSSLAAALQRDFNAWLSCVNVPLLLVVRGNEEVLAVQPFLPSKLFV